MNGHPYKIIARAVSPKKIHQFAYDWDLIGRKKRLTGKIQGKLLT